MQGVVADDVEIIVEGSAPGGPAGPRWHCTHGLNRIAG
jgi:hypothetical protein